MLNSIALSRPLPRLLKTENGSEFTGKILDKWVYERGIRIDFSRQGTPTDNATVGSFNGRLRQECLNENWFMSLEDARCKIEAWRIHYIRGVPILHRAGLRHPNSLISMPVARICSQHEAGYS